MIIAVTISALIAQAVISPHREDTPSGEYRVIERSIDTSPVAPVAWVCRLTGLCTWKAHVDDYFSTVGADEGAGYVVAYLAVVHEDWRKIGDVWHVDQWVFTAGTSGNLYYPGSVGHNQVCERDNGVVVFDGCPMPPFPTEVQAQFEWDALMRMWLGADPNIEALQSAPTTTPPTRAP